MEIEEITKRLFEIDPKILGSFLYHLRKAWLHATLSHRKLLQPALEAVFEEYPSVFQSGSSIEEI